MNRLFATACLAAAIAISGCGGPPPGPARDIHVENGTTLDVAVTMNGKVVDIVGAGVSKVVSRAALPDLPSQLFAESPSGTQLISFSVNGDAPGGRRL